MPEDTEARYDVRSANSGAQVIINVDHATAVAECGRLNHEARQFDRWRGEPVGMHKGRMTRYEVVSVGGVIVGGE